MQIHSTDHSQIERNERRGFHFSKHTKSSILIAFYSSGYFMKYTWDGND